MPSHGAQAGKDRKDSDFNNYTDVKEKSKSSAFFKCGSASPGHHSGEGDLQSWALGYRMSSRWCRQQTWRLCLHSRYLLMTHNKCNLRQASPSLLVDYSLLSFEIYNYTQTTNK